MKVNKCFQEINFCEFFFFKCIAKSNTVDVEKQLCFIWCIKN